MAASQKFRLERVRALREQLEGRSQEELASSLNSHVRVEAELLSAVEGVEHARRSVHATGSAGSNGAREIASAHAYFTRMEQVRRSATDSVARSAAEVDRRRAELTAAARERQVLERLKDRHVENVRHESLRQEGQLLDELGISRHRKRDGSQA